jgi:hypothetical protein
MPNLEFSQNGSLELTHPNQEFKLMENPDDILDDMISEIQSLQPGEKITIRAMLILDSDPMRRLEPYLIEAIKRGNPVNIIYDPISINTSLGVYPSWLKNTPIPGHDEIANNQQATLDLHKRLRENGINMKQSKPNSLGRKIVPFAGVDHIKGVVIGKKAYVLDKNFDDTTFKNMLGFAIKISNPDIVEGFAKIIESEKLPDKDQRIQLTPDTQLLVDTGQRGKSIIYDDTVEIMSRSIGKVRSGFQLFPVGKLLNAMNKAVLKNGAKLEPIVSKPETYGAGPFYFLDRLSAKMVRMSNSPARFIYVPKPGIHAKYITTEYLNELNLVEKVAIFGSNNFHETGVYAGTAEIAFRTTNPDLIALIEQFHDRNAQRFRKN